MALQGQCYDLLARCQHNLTSLGSKFYMHLLSQCGSTYKCVSRSVPEMHFVSCLDVQQPVNNNIESRSRT